MTAIGTLAPPLVSFPMWLRLAGLPLLVVGFGLIVWSVRLFAKSATTIKPFEESAALVTTGPYRFSRNPIYLGMVVALVGIGLLLGAALPFVVVPVFAVVIDRLFIRAEQAMLSSTFGDSYRVYSQRVRRWL